jgi:hypothetical protein
MHEQSALTRFPAPVAARLSARLAVTVDFDQSGMLVTWDPFLPSQLEADEQAAYRAVRNGILIEAARLNDLEVMFFDVDAFGFGRRAA